MARRSKHEILALTAKLCGILRDAGLCISREIFDSGFSLTLQIRDFYYFHVYFTVRRVLYQVGGIQSMSALPGDPAFNPFNNHYDGASYKRICTEFGINPSSDFGFTIGKNMSWEESMVKSSWISNTQGG